MIETRRWKRIVDWLWSGYIAAAAAQAGAPVSAR